MNISIIGGGIAGLTTAIALRKLGIDAVVYERAAELKPIGAGIMMSPNAMKVFEWLGIKNQVVQAGIPLHNAIITNSQFVPLRKKEDPFFKDQGDSIIAIHRGTLHEILQANLPQGSIKTGYALKNMHWDGDIPTAEFEEGSQESGIILGADGLHSRTREILFPDSHTRYSGQTCWRGVVRFTLPAALQDTSIEAWGFKRRFGFVNIGKDLIYWYAAVSAAPHFTLPSPDVKSYLSGLFSAFHPVAGELIEQTDAAAIIRNDLEDLAPMDSWHRGNCCLLGDAAHASTPNLGQGAAQGIEDAYYLGQLLKKHTPKEAFYAFEKIRQPKVNHIVRTSRMIGHMAHSTFAQPLIKMMMKYTPARMLHQQMENVYNVQEPFVSS